MMLDDDGDVSLLWAGQARRKAVPVVNRRGPRATRSALTADAAALVEGLDAVSAMRFGAAAAGLKCTRFGGSMGAPRRDEVEAFLANRNSPRYLFCADGHGAPQGAQAPAKSSGETGRPLDGEARCWPTIAENPITNTMT